MKTLQEEREAIVEYLRDWIETALDADAHGSWHKAPNFDIIQDVAELMAPRIADKLLSHEEKVVARLRDEEAKKLEQIEKGAIKMLGAVIQTVCGDGGSFILPIGWELQEGILEREKLPDGRTSVRVITLPITDEV